MMIEPTGKDLLDSIQRFVLEAEDPEIKQELWEISDVLENGSITLDTALFWDHVEARKLLRKAFSEAGFLQITSGS
ncbi:hypothetical protein J7E38_16575 [Bacillus sp. ISL-35]|uniref:hypothetical protein n=1 Tax=Bacillus sp. ISL-35 TaxID=2819122 RepID=UPI001BE9199A|nr:hypothetical protein [Bacillus sp. ISL-35]MBT2680626.1 hypothetical protein [Bacillus sp. ISL-35]MBT2702743.1 hypothetical protein [Chryseobacterium sp. ISL-80]